MMQVIARLDVGDVTTITVLDQDGKVWSIFSHADGIDHMVNPSGGIFDDFERLPIRGQEVMQFLFDNV